MARPDKAAAVSELADEFRGSQGAVLTEYRGLSVKQLRELRQALGENASYAVVKNTLTKIAAKEAGVEGFDDLLQGPSAIAFIKGDPVETAKGLRDFAKAHPALVIKGGVLDGKPLSAGEISKFADLESREVLLAKLAGAMTASLQTAVFLLNAPLTKAAQLAAALQAKAEQDPSIHVNEAGEPASEDTIAVAEGTIETVEETGAEATTDDAAAEAVTSEPATPEEPTETAEETTEG